MTCETVKMPGRGMAIVCSRSRRRRASRTATSAPPGAATRNASDVSVWWDPHVERYRSTLPHKLVFGFGWTVVRWVMFHCMSSEAAHHWGIRSLRWFGSVDDAWSWATLLPKLLWLHSIRCMPIRLSHTGTKS